MKKLLLVTGLTVLIFGLSQMYFYGTRTVFSQNISAPHATVAMHTSEVTITRRDMAEISAAGQPEQATFAFTPGLSLAYPRRGSTINPAGSADSGTYFAFTLYNYNFEQICLVSDRYNNPIQKLVFAWSDGMRESLEPTAAPGMNIDGLIPRLQLLQLPNTDGRPVTIYLKINTSLYPDFAIRLADSALLSLRLRVYITLSYMFVGMSFFMLITLLVNIGKNTINYAKILPAFIILTLSILLFLLPIRQSTGWKQEFFATTLPAMLLLACGSQYYTVFCFLMHIQLRKNRALVLSIISLFGIAIIGLLSSTGIPALQQPVVSIALILPAAILLFSIVFHSKYLIRKKTNLSALMFFIPLVILQVNLLLRTAGNKTSFNSVEQSRLILMTFLQLCIIFSVAILRLHRGQASASKNLETLKLANSELKATIAGQERKTSRFLLNPLYGMQQTLASLDGSFTPEETMELLADLRNNLSGIIHFLGNLRYLHSQTLNSSDLIISQQNIATVIGSAIHMVQYLSMKNNVSYIIAETSLLLSTDFTILQKLLTNIVYRENIFYSVHRISITATKQHGSIRIEIKNDGIQEFPETDLETGVPARPVSTEVNDSDYNYPAELSLDYLKQNAALIHAELHYQYKNKENNFIITLPELTQGSEQTAVTISTRPPASLDYDFKLAQRPGPANATTSSGQRVYIVNDEPISLFAMKRSLEKHGWSVETCMQTQKAIDLLQNSSETAVILVESFMYHTTGYEFCRKLRALNLGRHLPVIIITGSTSFEQIQAVFQAGANDYLVRPFTTAELLARLTTHTELAASLRREIEHNSRMAEIEKIKTLSWLTTGLAHEINTPNNAILRNIPLLHEIWSEIGKAIEKLYNLEGSFNVRGFSYEELQAEIPAMLNDAYSSAQHIRKIVQELKEFSGGQKDTVLTFIDANQAVAYSLRLLRQAIANSTVKFSSSLAAQPLYILGDKLKLAQVVVNVVENSLQSLKSPNDAVQVKTSRLRGDGTGGQDRILLEISDEGIGMTKETLKAVYDPFFTTKRSSGGTGMGMPVVSGILRELHGEIQIQSEPGKGTQVRIWLPAVDHINEL
ncbi:MAG: response regulator [Spirochaetes bacterium]|nr:response regulator [Spirochaetota bacterium]MBU0954080.1 response regulator [Spirochaetota bacterium]